MKRNLSVLLIATSVYLLCQYDLNGQSSARKLEGTWEMRSKENGLEFEFNSSSKNSEEHMSHSIIINKS
jgi:hypothetical protein